MDISIVEKLKEQLKKTLPGLDAQLLMASDVRFKFSDIEVKQRDAKRSSVLILLYPINNCIHIVLIQRPTYAGVHSGQISFPGGQFEESDKNPVDTALREASEEVGINADEVRIIGQLTNLYIPPSNYLVTPVIGFTDEHPLFQLQASEVKNIIETPLINFLKKETIKSTTIRLENGMSFETPYYDIKGNVVWGATAMMMSEFVVILKKLVE